MRAALAGLAAALAAVCALLIVVARRSPPVPRLVASAFLPPAPSQSPLPAPHLPRPTYRSWDDLSYEVRAVEVIRPILDRDGFVFDTVECWRDGDVQICAVCSHHPTRHHLGASLVMCNERRCQWLLWEDKQRFADRAGWVPDDCIQREYR